jgi:hypothetical protein
MILGFRLMNVSLVWPRMSDYPDNEFPWTFYFNGIALSKWGACWGMADICSFIDLRDSWDWDVGPRDIWNVYCSIDHVGVVESADPDIFRYVVQEVLCILLEKREAVFEKLKRGWDFPADPDEVYNGLVEAAFQMRELAIRDGRAFWISGYEPDRLQLVEAIRRASLPPGSLEYAPAPHVSSLRSELESLWRQQAKTLHRVASAGRMSKEFRRKLLQVTQT